MMKFNLQEVCYFIVSQFFRFAEGKEEIRAADLERNFTEEFSHAFRVDEDTAMRTYNLPFWVLCNAQDTGIYTQKMHYFAPGPDAKWELRLIPKKEMITLENRAKYSQRMLEQYGEDLKARLDLIL